MKGSPSGRRRYTDGILSEPLNLAIVPSGERRKTKAEIAAEDPSLLEEQADFIARCMQGEPTPEAASKFFNLIRVLGAELGVRAAPDHLLPTETDSHRCYFWTELALALMIRHVPAFARRPRGRFKTPPDTHLSWLEHYEHLRADRGNVRDSVIYEALAKRMGSTPERVRGHIRRARAWQKVRNAP